MPLQLPNLDDRRYDDLVAEALARIPTYAQEWTNHNPSDPGITLVELFAYLTDILIYRLNRVTDENKRRFLKLLNSPAWETGDLAAELRKAVLAVRERYRAVTREDYEVLSTEAFNRFLADAQRSSVELVARAYCVPQRNLEAGAESDRLKPRPEHVSVVVVPSQQRTNPHPPPPLLTPGTPGPVDPQPSDALIAALFAFLDERRMLTTKLHVTGPFYVHVSAQLVIAREGDALDDDVVAAVNERLRSLLDPLPSDDGDGWPFGRDVFVSQVYGALDLVPGINFITDVMLSSRCAGGDVKCVVADQVWHVEGDLVGLRIEDHHLPIFDHAEIVVAPSDSFIRANLSLSARGRSDADPAALKRAIKTAVRDIFHPASGGPGPGTLHPTDIFVSDIAVPIRNIAGILAIDPLAVDCVPSSVLQKDPDRGAYLHVAPGHVVDWRVAITLTQ
ncbi:MAG TPA: hypothetical protein VMI52_04735 [Acetobacteraceae bacterium]|nr:hypothetical protein [Acetobacteraceae bacterium]